MSLGVRRLGLIVALCVFVSACNGGSGSDVVAPNGGTAVETPVAATPSVTDVSPTPTTEPSAPEPSDKAKIEAAVAALASDPLPADLVAYDLLDARLRGTTGVVDLEVCGWTGDTVFDDVYLISYRSTDKDDGTAGATLESATTTLGDCTNTSLIESALQATRDYDDYWSAVAASPSTFDPAEAAMFLAAQTVDVVGPTLAGWTEDGLAYPYSYLDGALPGSSQEDVLFRTYELSELGIVELIACRPMPSGFGLYSGDLLVDDFKDDVVGGEQAINYYQLTFEGDDLVVLGLEELVWANCSGFSDSWFEGVNRLFPDAGPWARLQG